MDISPGYEELHGCIFCTIESGKEDDTEHITYLRELDECVRRNPGVLIYLDE